MAQPGQRQLQAQGDIGVPLETRPVAWVRGSGQITDDVRCWRTISFGSLPPTIHQPIGCGPGITFRDASRPQEVLYLKVIQDSFRHRLSRSKFSFGPNTALTHGLWFHVDGAWGGAAALSSRLRPILAGIERADSITCDAHKWLSVPVGAGMFFCRHREAVEATFGTETAYVPDRVDDGRIYHFVTSMQWSRRFMGLKLFMMLAEHGIDGIAARIDRQTETGEYLRDQLARAGFRILNATPLPVVCFTHPSIEAGEISTEGVVTELRRKQQAWISKTLLRGKTPPLRACIANFATALKTSTGSCTRCERSCRPRRLSASARQLARPYVLERPTRRPWRFSCNGELAIIQAL